MDYDGFLSIVRRWTDADRDAAERAVRATLQTLAEPCSPAIARAVAAQLPPELLGWLHTTTDPERIDVDEFLARLAAREGVDATTAEEHTRAVFRALRAALPADELRRLVAE